MQEGATINLLGKIIERPLVLKKETMKKVYVTAQGALMPANNWKEGQEIECHENIAAMYIARGIATEVAGEVKPEKPKTEPKVKPEKPKTK